MLHVDPLGSGRPAGSGAWGRGVKVAGYVHPGIFPQGPCFNFVWAEILGRLLQGLHRDAGSDCLLISGSRFLRQAREPRSDDLFDGIRIAEVQETALLRRLSALGVVPTALDRLAYGAGGEHHPALRVLAEEVLRASAGFVPDVVISFATPTDFLARSWPGALRLHVESGPYARNPYPQSLFFDHLGMYGRSVIARASTRLREFTVSPEQAGFVAAFRRHYAVVLEAIDPFCDLDLRGPFDRVCLLPLQVSDWYGFDEQVSYRTQFEFLIDVLSATPPDVRVVVTEYPYWGPVIKRSGPGRNLDYLRRIFPNMLFLEAFNAYQSPSQSLVPRVDGVWSVSSNVAYQAILFGRLLGTPPSTHLAGIAHTTRFAEFFETLGRVPPQSRDAFLAWQLERYVVPRALWSDGAWLDDYLRRRIEAAGATSDPVEAFVPIAGPARLEETWIRQAPRPAAEPYESELDALRKANEAMLQSRSWRLTAPLRAIAQSVRGTRIKK
jgi:hypothetical protein